MNLEIWIECEQFFTNFSHIICHVKKIVKMNPLPFGSVKWYDQKQQKTRNRPDHDDDRCESESAMMIKMETLGAFILKFQFRLGYKTLRIHDPIETEVRQLRLDTKKRHLGTTLNILGWTFGKAIILNECESRSHPLVISRQMSLIHSSL